MDDHLTVGRGDRIVIMIHGFLARAAQLWPLAKRMAKKVPSLRFVLPELPGHGRTLLPPNASLADLAAHVLDLADRAGAERFSLVGHSMGGRVALELGMSHPDRVDDIVVLDVSAGDLTARPSPISGMMQALLRAPDRASDRRAMRQALIEAGAEPKEADALLVHVDPRTAAWNIDRRALCALRMDTMSTDLWSGVHPRVGLVYGTESPFVKAEDLERYRSAGAAIVAIERAGHFLHQEALDAVIDAILALLRIR